MNFEQIQKYFKMILDSLVIKYQYDANAEDTIESVLAFERYKIAKRNEDTIYSHPTIDLDVLLDAGFSESEARYYSDNPTEIPQEYQSLVLELNREFIIETYETNGTFDMETNNYYRTLMGLPPVSATEDDFFYTPEDIADIYGIDTDTPIHLLSDSELVLLKNYGFIDELISENKNAKYLKFLGKDSIDLITAREAKNFILLKCTTDLPRTLYESFIETYSNARDFIIQVYYIKEFRNKYTNFDKFIGAIISITALFRIIVKLFHNVLESDYYDIKSIISFFDSYHMPYVQELEFEFQKILAANLRYLIRIKAEDDVLREVSKLLGFTDSKIMRYYLVKEHILDPNEEPVFYYKEVTQEDGTVKKELDYEKTYNVYFQQISIDEENLQIALADKSSRISYKEMISEDPYWIDDDAMHELLYTTDYNYTMTKYIGLNVTFKFTEVLFDLCYTTRMIFDLKEYTSRIMLNLETISATPIPLFDTFIMLLCITCRQTSLKGSLPTSASKVSVISGFNFNDIHQIKDLILEAKNNKVITQEEYDTMFHLIANTYPLTASDVNTLYMNIRKMRNFINDCMRRYTGNLKTYRFYKSLYKTIMFTEDINTLYTMSNGKVAKTYFEYLEDLNPSLYTYTMEIEDDYLSSAINYLASKITKYLSNVKYLHMANQDSNAEAIILRRFLNIFKSYTADLSTMNITYLLNDKNDNFIHLSQDIRKEKELLLKERLNRDHNHVVKVEKELMIKDKRGFFKKDGIVKYIME